MLCDLPRWKRQEAEELAEMIRSSPAWDLDAVHDLCYLAGLGGEFEAADAENFEAVIFKAAALLGVEVIR